MRDLLHTARDIFRGSKRTRDSVLGERYGDQERAKKVSLKYAIVNTLVHRHILVERIVETDEEFVKLLVALVKRYL